MDERLLADPQPRPVQGELALPAPPLPEDMPLIPARMVNEFQYCPRLAWLEWVESEWAESADTVEGKRIHRNVDRPTPDELPPPGDLAEDERLHARSVTLSSRGLGVIAKLDLIDADGGVVIPVDYKRGKRPHLAAGGHDPERVQLCLQGLLLAEHGYACTEGALYFRESRERVRIVFDEPLQQITRAAVHGLRLMAATGRIPPPTEEIYKCPRCSLVGICLPDEVRALTRGSGAPRPVAAPRVEGLPVYVQAGKGKVSKSGETLEITKDDEPPVQVRLIDVSELVIFGNVYVTTPCQLELMQRDIPITWHTYGGWFCGHTVGTGHRNGELRAAQYRSAFDDSFCLRFARDLVTAKARNSRTLLRRNWHGSGDSTELLDTIRRAEQRAQTAPDLGSLLGLEGTAAAAWFAGFGQLIRGSEPPEAGGGGDGSSPGFSFDFTCRNRRPPTDPVNALLSFTYALLARTFTVLLSGIGLDPYCGFYHQPRYGRPALALDMMEPYRPVIADSAVLTAINNGEVKPDGFVRAAGAVAMNSATRKAMIAAFERRLAQEMTHPVFGYVVSWRQALHIQARLLARHLTGELPKMPHITTR